MLNQEVGKMRSIKRSGRAPLLFTATALLVVGLIGTAGAALLGSEKAKRPQVLIGADNDTNADPTIQNGAAADQSLTAGDQLDGGLASDTLIGRLGPDVFRAGAGDDVIVGGTEGGGNPAFPNKDIAYGAQGSDTFIWAPGDGSDAFIGGDPAKVKPVKKTKVKASATPKGKKKKKKVKVQPEVDSLVVGNLVLTGDLSTPQLFRTRFGQLPLVFSSDIGVPTPLGGPAPGRNPNLTGSCQILSAPPGLGYDYLVRFFGNTPQSSATQAVTIRVRGVEQVICPTEGASTATQTALGPRGTGPVQVKTTAFTAPKGSQLAAFVR
jgi:RTX calcium-binding nonapeptide repeat (4 copies)